MKIYIVMPIADDYVADNSGAQSGYFTDRELAEKECKKMNQDYKEEYYGEYDHEDHFVVIAIQPDAKQICSDIGSDAT